MGRADPPHDAQRRWWGQSAPAPDRTTERCCPGPRAIATSAWAPSDQPTVSQGCSAPWLPIDLAFAALLVLLACTALLAASRACWPGAAGRAYRNPTEIQLCCWWPMGQNRVHVLPRAAVLRSDGRQPLPRGAALGGKSCCRSAPQRVGCAAAGGQAAVVPAAGDGCPRDGLRLAAPAR